jgi:hypothetical protein
MFVLLSAKVEKWLFLAIAGLVILLLMSQLLLQVPAIRSTLVKVERMEGVPYRQH